MGYQELATETVGNKLIAPTFLNISESNKVTLADLKVSGYTAPYKDNKGKWKGGCTAGKFVVQLLTPNGTLDKEYNWLDTGVIGPGWFADSAGTPIAGGAESVELTAGKALWTIGSGYKLVPAGAVNPFDIVYETLATGNVAIGNPTPNNLTLASLTVSGYTAPYKDNKGKWKGGCTAGKFVVQLLTPNGTLDKEYNWLDTGVIGPGWFADSAGTPIAGGAESVPFSAGNGLWVIGSGYKLVIPAPEL